jgi:hypothetical protein
MPESAPRVFLSHASDDKDSFVIPFATALRAQGLDLWLDRWEMRPGDSLVDRIFTEGLGAAAAVVVVLSNASVKKRWVAEELDAAVIKRIQENARLIPIVLDGLDVSELPVAIRHLLFEAVPDRSDYQGAVERVVRSVFGTSDKPPLGSPPIYAQSDSAGVLGLDRIDALVLKAIGDEAVRDFGEHFKTAEFLGEITVSLGITEAQAIESLEVLSADGYVSINRTIGQGIPSMAHFKLTQLGLGVYASTFVQSYDQMRQAVISRLAGWPSDQGTDEQLAVEAEVPRLLVLHLLRDLDGRALLHLSQPLGPWAHFHGISPKLRRMT